MSNDLTNTNDITPNTTPLASIFSYRKFWAKRFGTAPILPMSREEMENLGWDSCDIILVTGDAYIDHPSFGMALIGRLLESQGFRIGIISQPNWNNVDDFKILGKPNLFFGVTSGNMDSMVNHYTADKRIRTDDAYTPNGEAGKRPNRAVIVYANRCREAFPETPIVLGGIEASLRRLAHYDYWADQIRRSILVDSKADILLYGNAERALVELSHRLARRENINDITDLRGSVILRKKSSANFQEIDATSLKYSIESKNSEPSNTKFAVRIPSFEQVKTDSVLFAHASRLTYLETNPYNAKVLIQAHNDRDIIVNPPPYPLTSKELDGIYDLPYSRKPHPVYYDKPIPAYEMIRFSVTIMRGCFGGCTFCSITLHEGRIIQNRSEESILHEIEKIRDEVPGFTGIISDIGGPTANMYNLKCSNFKCEASCKKLSCVHPNICKNMSTNHTTLINLYRKARELKGIKKVLIGSGVRYDLAIKSKEYVKELVSHHIGGYLKIAPEHICEGPLSKMMKPGIDSYKNFKELFDQFSKEAGKEQYLIPYFIAAHPGTTDEDMVELALWLKTNNYRLDKVQNFLPTPMTLATTMYCTSRNPLKNIDKNEPKVHVSKSGRSRRLHKALLRYHDPHNWPFLRQELKRLGRIDLIGNGKKHLVPLFQPNLKTIL